MCPKCYQSLAAGTCSLQSTLGKASSDLPSVGQDYVFRYRDAKTEQGKNRHQFIFGMVMRANPSLHTQMGISSLCLAFFLNSLLFSPALSVSCLKSVSRKGGCPAKLWVSSRGFRRCLPHRWLLGNTERSFHVRPGPGSYNISFSVFLQREKNRFFLCGDRFLNIFSY